MTVRLLIADDHPVVRKGLRAVLEAQPDFSVVAEAGDGISAVQLAEEHKPDVLIVDMLMPGLDGTEVARRVKERQLRARVLMLSIHSEESYVLQALRNGADGYVLKDASSAELVRAVQEIVKGRTFLSPPLNEQDLKTYFEKVKEGTLDAYEMLTDREREVLHLAAEGHTTGAIGQILGISPRTAESHRVNLMRKLGLRSQTELVKYAIKRGIVRPG